MIIYQSELTMENEIHEKVKGLLEIEEISSMKIPNLYNAKINDSVGLFLIEFENGNYLTITLCSGSKRYHEYVVLYNEKDEELFCMEPNSILETHIEILYEEDIYIIDINIKE